MYNVYIEKKGDVFMGGQVREGETRVNLQMKVEDMAEFKKIAESQCRSRNSLMRYILEQWLKDYKQSNK